MPLPSIGNSESNSKRTYGTGLSKTLAWTQLPPVLQLRQRNPVRTLLSGSTLGRAAIIGSVIDVCCKKSLMAYGSYCATELPNEFIGCLRMCGKTPTCCRSLASSRENIMTGLRSKRPESSLFWTVSDQRMRLYLISSNGFFPGNHRLLMRMSSKNSCPFPLIPATQTPPP